MGKRQIDTKLWRTGNSYVVTIPAKLVRKWGLEIGRELEITIKSDLASTGMPARSETTKWQDTKMSPQMAKKKEQI